MSLYHCKHCGDTTERDSTKAWIRSYCMDTGKETRLVRVKGTVAKATRVAGSKATKTQ